MLLSCVLINLTWDLPGALMAWPTLLDQPTGCRRGLHMWHQKSEMTFSGESLWSVYTSRRRPPVTESMMATRVRLTCLGSTTSTCIPTLKEVLMLSASWKKTEGQIIILIMCSFNSVWLNKLCYVTICNHMYNTGEFLFMTKIRLINQSDLWIKSDSFTFR